jgi:hypothetical protein
VLKKLNRFDTAQVSNLRGEAVNWQQQAMIVVQKLITKNRGDCFSAFGGSQENL